MLVHCPSCQHVNSDSDPVCNHCGVAAAGANVGAPGEGIFFPVSVLKLAVMTICTLGFYEMFWFFQCWNYLKRAKGMKVNLFARAFFGVFYCYPLFKEIRDVGKTINPNSQLAAGPLAAMWILLSLLWKLPDPYWLVTYLAFVPLLIVQSYIIGLNKYAGKEQYINAKFSVINWVTIVIGGGFFILAIVGTIMPK